MADNVVISAGTGTTVHADEYTHGTLGSGKTQLVKLVDGTLDSGTPIVVDVGVKANALRVCPANDITDGTYIGDIKFGEALPAGSNAIGKLAANTGVDIGDVDILSIAAGDNNIGNVDIVTVPAPLNVVGGGAEATAIRVTIANDSTGLLSVDDGGGALTVDGTVTANLSATDNAVLDVIAGDTTSLDTKVTACNTGAVVISSGTVTTVSTVTNLSQMGGTAISMNEGVLDAGTQRVTLATDDDGVAHLATIAGDTTSIDGKITACNTGAVVLTTGSAAIGKLAANTGVDIGDVDVTSIVPGVGATNLGKARDSALGATDTGVMALAVRDDTLTTLTPADGDYVPLRVNSTGALHVTGAGGGTQYAEDAAHSSGATGTLALVVRKDTAAQLAGTDADYSALITDANGRLHVVSSARANGVAAVTDWTAVAQNAVGESGTVDCSTHDGTSLLIQAFLDTTTAHTGTEFMIQVSSNTTGNEDWHDYRPFTALVGTAATDLIEDNPLTAGSTSLTLTGHALTEEGIWIGIENGTLANSELIYVASQSTNAVVALDGTTNEHALNTAVFNVAISKVIILDATVQRARVIVNNTKDADGSSLNYKVRATNLSR